MTCVSWVRSECLCQLSGLHTPALWLAHCCLPHPSVHSPVLHLHRSKLSVSRDRLFHKVKSWDYFVSWPESQSLFTDGHSDTFNSQLWHELFHSDNVSWPTENNESRAVNGSYSPSVKFLRRVKIAEMTWENLGLIWLLSGQPHPTPSGSNPALQYAYMIFIT